MEIFFQLVLATLLGGLVGLEREHKRKGAGLRTYALVSLGAALFTITAFQVSSTSIAFDPSRIIGQIVVGVGFIGAGLIIHRGEQIGGLTTAAGIWVVSAVGAAVGIKLYSLAVFTTILAIGILVGLRFIEKKFFNKDQSEETAEQ